MATDRSPSHRRFHERGAALLVVLMILVAVSILGLGASQIALMGERGARNDRDLEMARQGAEAALADAEKDIEAAGDTPLARPQVFAPAGAAFFVDGCGSSGVQQGLCTESAAGLPAWLATDMASEDKPSRTVAFGTFTGGILQAGTGLRPGRAPRYLIERIGSLHGAANAPAGTEIGLTRSGLHKSHAATYRITAIGFGPRSGSHSVMQTVYRKE